MGEPIRLSYDDVGDITMIRAGWAAFRGWWDAVTRGRGSDAVTNLCADCAQTPPAGELANLFEEWGFLPAELAGELLGAVGAPAGNLNGKYPMTRLADERAKHAHVEESQKALEVMRARTATAPDDLSEETKAGIAKTQESIARAGAEIHELTVSLIPLEVLDRTETRCKRALFVRGPAGLLIFRPPSASVADRYTDAVAAFFANKPEASFAAACRALVLGCAIEPEPTTLAAQIDEFPAIAYCLYDVLREAGTPKARPRS